VVVTRFFGKYRGTVANNVDPLQQGRLQVRCPAVLGEEQQSWALPSTPYCGPGVGFFALPPTGANVWVEFEGGDPDYPIWTGCFWGPGEAPALPATPQVKIFKTEGMTLTINDAPEAGGVTIEVSPPIVATLLKISLTGSGIELTSGGQHHAERRGAVAQHIATEE
jgi:hypothetical protein